jgi:transcriptional regulator with XRE-family HTH domain
MSRLLKLIDQYNRTRPEGEPPLNKTRLAEAAGISRPTLNAIEAGRIGLLRPVQSVADVLGVPVTELIDAA